MQAQSDKNANILNKQLHTAVHGTAAFDAFHSMIDRVATTVLNPLDGKKVRKYVFWDELMNANGTYKLLSDRRRVEKGGGRG